MRPAAEFKGRPASQGIFAGPVAGLGGVGARRRQSGNPARERTDLEAAIAAASTAIAGLMERMESEAAEMLGFQLAMPEDAALAAPAFAALSMQIARQWRQARE